MTENENTEWTPSLRDWLRIADFQVAQSFGAAFAAEGLSRRDGMLLRRLAKGTLTTDRDKKLRSLEDRGWVEVLLAAAVQGEIPASVSRSRTPA